ncbi:MAG: MOSC domain-containing protein [Mycobacterium sp.]
MPSILTVNLAHPRHSPDKSVLSTGIDKRPVDTAVEVRAPGPQQGGLGSGLVGDLIGNPKFHGGDDQAVYTYAREDLNAWETELQRELSNGMFGENFTMAGIDVNEARIGERWSIGTGGLELEVTSPRIPCHTFADFLSLRGWTKRFTEAAKPGAYLRVISPGTVNAGDQVVVTHRPEHDVTVRLAFRALTREPELLPDLLAAEALPERIRQQVRRRAG